MNLCKRRTLAIFGGLATWTPDSLHKDPMSAHGPRPPAGGYGTRYRLRLTKTRQQKMTEEKID